MLGTRTRAPDPPGRAMDHGRSAPGRDESIVGELNRWRTVTSAGESRRHRVTVAPEGHAGVVRPTGPARWWPGRALPAERAAARASASSPPRRRVQRRVVASSCPPPVDLSVRGRSSVVAAEEVEGAWASSWSGCGHGAPPTPAGEAHGGFDCTLAVAAPRRTGLDDRPSAWPLERRRLDVALPARSPWPGGRSATPGRAAQAPQHLVHGPDEMGLVHLLGQHAADLARMRQRAQQHVGRRTPRSVGARTSPTGSPRPVDGRSRWCPGP